MNLFLLGLIVFCLVGGYLILTANACGFVSPESIEERNELYYDRYDSSNWTFPDNIYNPDNYEECRMLGWC